MNHEEWLERRKTGITGTDICAIMGLSKYKSVKDVWYDKLGYGHPVVENEKMKWGKILEPVIRDYYAEKNNVKVAEVGFVRHPTEPWIIGTPDGVVVDDNGKHQWLIEIKTARVMNKSTEKLWSEGSVPVDYMYQVYWYLLLLDLPFGDVAVLKNGSEYAQIRINRNKEQEEAMIQKCKDFWFNYVVPRVQVS